MSEFIKAEEITKNRVRYTDSNGRVFIYSKGTWAWRNNNPGNIRKPGKETKLEGIIGYKLPDLIGVEMGDFFHHW